MKKAILKILSVVSVILCLVSVILSRHKADLYSVLYPQNVTIESTDTIRSVELNKGDSFVFGKIYGEEIIWKVIADGENFLVWSENAICFRPFDKKSSDWQTSDLREWLNSEDGFLSEENFTSTEMIKENKEADKMFLLSKNQLQKFSESERAKAPTVSAVANDGSDRLIIRKNCWYWTSSPIQTNSSSVTTVTNAGGFYKTLSTDTVVGVCPAFYLCDNTVIVCGGNGTKEKPYVLLSGGESR